MFELYIYKFTKSGLVCIPLYERLQPVPWSPSPSWFCPWWSLTHIYLNKSTGVDCHALLQGIFLTQGPDLHLLPWQADSLPLSQFSLALQVPEEEYSLESAPSAFPKFWKYLNLELLNKNSLCLKKLQMASASVMEIWLIQVVFPLSNK